jgi:hypothetical protein
MIIIYRDDNAHSIFIKDSNGAQFVNSLQAVSENGTISIRDTVKDEDIVTDIAFDQFLRKDETTPYGSDLTETVNALNVEFTISGSSTGESPNITSALTINLVAGEVLNYELTADYGVGYEWDLSNVSGVVTVEGNPRKLIGGSSLAVGTYNIPVKAINYNGEDSQTIVLTVATPPYSNTKSIKFSNQDWLGANARQVAPVLGRSSTGLGSSDAWSIALYYKPSEDTQGQCILYFGSSYVTYWGYIELRQTDIKGKKRLRLHYGSDDNYLQFSTSAGSLRPKEWHHILVTYDGGTTGSSSENLSNFYSRFKIFIDGSLQSTENTHSKYGWSGSIMAHNWRIGRSVFGSHMQQANVDELALFDSDQSSNVSSLYNRGTPFDLSTLSTKPVHWWKMGDGDKFPYLQDSGTAANCVFQMYNMTVADIVSDVP